MFRHALSHKIPILMVTSGGYQKKNAITIAESLKNLDEKFGLFSEGGNKRPAGISNPLKQTEAYIELS